MTFNIPENLMYTRSHEWLLVEGEIATVGITDYAQDALGDVVYVELPQVGDSFEAGGVFGTIESVKAASDLYTPLGGEVVEVNSELEGVPEKINEDSYGAAWMIKLKFTSQPEGLLDAQAYTALVAEAEH